MKPHEFESDLLGLQSAPRRILHGLGRWLLLLVSARVVVEGDSMWPALRAGDRLLVNRLAYRLSPPRRGDIVLLRDPERPGFECIKRIAALPGEHVDEGNRGQGTGNRQQGTGDRQQGTGDLGGHVGPPLPAYPVGADPRVRPAPPPAQSSSSSPPSFPSPGLPGQGAGGLGNAPVHAEIPAEHYFVLGDNRGFSRDSRAFGPIHRSAIVGRAWHRYSRDP